MLKHAATALAEFLAKRARAAEAATTAADAEKARELKLCQAGFRQAWAQSVEEGAISVVRERFERIELKGVPVLVPPTAAPSTLDELHGALREIDPGYDPKYSSMKDLAKMPKIKALLEDKAHCFDSTYALDLHDCGDPSCPFGCSDWRTELQAEATDRGCEPAKVEKAVRLLERRSVLPMAANKGNVFLPYLEASKLPTTDERDLPSRAAALAGAKKTEVRKRQEAADRAKAVAVGDRIFHVSKVCLFRPGIGLALTIPHSRPSPPLRSTPGALGHFLRGLPTAAPTLLDGKAVGGLAQEHGHVHRGHRVSVRRPAVRGRAGG